MKDIPGTAKAQPTEERCRLYHGIDCRLFGCAGNIETQLRPTTRSREAFATGSEPRTKALYAAADGSRLGSFRSPTRSRVVRLGVPSHGMRCPRCHGFAPRADGIPCALCAPDFA